MNTEHFKEKLEEERALIVKQLGDIAIEGENGIWEAKAPEMDVLPPQADPNEAADKIEELNQRSGEVGTLSARLTEVRDALERIGQGAYGICEAGGEEIEEERLEANPAARTCMQHMQ
jgi:DnaK suppressor protein